MILGGIANIFIGLALTFASVALLVSTVTEAIASALKWRANNLLEGLKTILNVQPADTVRRFLPPLSAFVPPSGTSPNAKLLNDLLNHAAINPRGPGNNAQLSAQQSVQPSYIPPAQFALALIDVIQTAPDGTHPSLKAAIGQIKDDQLKRFLQGAYERAGGDADKVRKEVADWFDSAMDRISGDYKRYVQLWSFLIALVIAVLFNIDALAIASAMLSNPAMVQNVQVTVSTADGMKNLADMQKDGFPVGWTITGDGTLGQAIATLGGKIADKPLHAALAAVVKLFGWLVTAGAALFGAPFWFDTLQQFVRLRGTGSKPDSAGPT